MLRLVCNRVDYGRFISAQETQTVPQSPRQLTVDRREFEIDILRQLADGSAKWKIAAEKARPVSGLVVSAPLCLGQDIATVIAAVSAIIADAAPRSDRVPAAARGDARRGRQP
jgi:hypothetical protein